MINVEQTGTFFRVTLEVTGLGEDRVYVGFFTDTGECPLPAGTLNTYRDADGIYQIERTVNAGNCQTIAIMIAENNAWVNRKQSLVINLDNR